MKHYLKKLSPKLFKSEAFSHSRFSRANLIVFAVIFASIGGYAIYSSFAAGTGCTGPPLSSGASVSSALNSAQPGDVICLNAGTYSFDTSVNKSAMTTVRAADGLTKSQVIFTTLNVHDSNNLTFQTFTSGFVIGNGFLGGAAHNITMKDFTATSPSCIYAGNNGPLNITVDGGYFGNLGQSCDEGRLGINGLNPTTDYTVNQNIVVKNSEFAGTSATGASDGVQTTGGPKGITIGPGNYFHDILQGGCDAFDPAHPPHCDSVQLYAMFDATVAGNFFYNNSDSVADADTYGNDQIDGFTDNVMYQEPSSATPNAYLAGVATGAQVAHNTLGPGSDIYFGPGNQNDTSTGVFVHDNAGPGGVNTERCVSCTITNNPTSVTFTGGALPTTWTGFQLVSPLNTATDGGNVGSRIFDQTDGSGSTGPSDTTAPTNVLMTAPANNATVSGSSVALSATADDDVGVTSVQFLLDGNTVGSDSSSPYSIVWDSTTTINGIHTLTVVARDAAGNSTTSSPVTVTVNNIITGDFNIGEPTITATDDSGNSTLLLAQQATLTTQATIKSLSFYVTAAAGKLRLGVYNANGPGGGPGIKVAETAEMTPTTGWNTANVTSQLSLAPGSYWLAYQPSSDGLHFRKTDTSTVPSQLYTHAYGALPNTFATTGLSATSSHWSLYATLTADSSSDTTNPTVSITAPTTGATLSGATNSVAATATDPGTNPSGVAGVQFYLDYASDPNTNKLGSEDTSSPYTTNLDTTTLANGAHTLTAIARDAAGNSTTSSTINITINNVATPDPDTTAPNTPTGLTSSAKTATTITLSWNAATDPTISGAATSGLAGYKLYRSTTSTGTYSLVTTTTLTNFTDNNASAGLTPNTNYFYKITSYDNATNESAKSTALSVTTNDLTPTVTIAVSPTTITTGSSSTLSWSSTHATACTASSGWSGAKATSGTQSVSPTATTTYTLACTGTGGTTNNSTTLTVNSVNPTPTPPPPTPTPPTPTPPTPTPTPTPTPPPATNTKYCDLNNDGTVNIFDLSIMLTKYGSGAGSSADVNHDSSVNIFDLSILLSNYGK